VYAHGVDYGVSVDDEVLLILSFFGDIFEKFVYVVPSFRGETLEFDKISWTSEGEDSPWDYDVDDALSLLNATFDLEPGSDPERVGVLGFSRGAGVGMLMDARSDKIDAVLNFFGPTEIVPSRSSKTSLGDISLRAQSNSTALFSASVGSAKRTAISTPPTTSSPESLDSSHPPRTNTLSAIQIACFILPDG
jgi:hypothetical protein